jgi:hypothetical protein
MDFITSIHKSKGNNFIAVVIDRLTKYAHFYSLSRSLKVIIVATTFMETIKNLDGIPKIIVSHRDPIFTSNFYIELFSFFGCSVGSHLLLPSSF